MLVPRPSIMAFSNDRNMLGWKSGRLLAKNLAPEATASQDFVCFFDLDIDHGLLVGGQL